MVRKSTSLVPPCNKLQQSKDNTLALSQVVCRGGGEGGGRDLLNANSPTGLASIFRQIVRDEWVNDY